MITLEPKETTHELISREREKCSPNRKNLLYIDSVSLFMERRRFAEET